MPDALSDIYSQAVTAHKKGDFASAEASYRKILANRPDEAEVQYLLGATLFQQGRASDAIAPLRACLARQPVHGPALNILGSALSILERHEDAIAALKEAASAAPDDSKILFNLGKACIDGKKFDLGAGTFSTYLTKAPDHIDALNGLAICLSHTGRVQEAISKLEQCTDTGLATSVTYENLIRMLLEEKRYDDALKHSEIAQKRWPDDNTLLLAHASTLHLLKRNEDACQAYENLVAKEPENEGLLNKFAGFLYDVGRWKDAEEYAWRALNIAPHSVHFLTNLGRIRQQRGDLIGALEIYKKALDLDPYHADAHNNLANLLLYMDEIDGALEHFSKAIELKPKSNGMRFNRSVALMTKGAIGQAWREHRLRFEKEEPSAARTWTWPEWNGESLGGKRILLWGEQGIGDQIIHARSARLVAAHSASCALECSKRLTKLFERSFDDIEVYGATAPAAKDLLAGPFDYQCSTLDMNCALHESAADISPQSYLKADPERTSDLRKKYHSEFGNRPLIGLSWWSGFNFQSHFKSTSLKMWKNILSTPDAAFISLQYGDRHHEIDSLHKETGLRVNVDPEIDPLGDLDVFAAQVAAMDLVITISNTTAHMAGALGVPTWTMTPTGPGRLWYWFQEGQKSPWYESMKLFRHTYDEGWDSVLDTIADLLPQELAGLADRYTAPC